MSQFQFIRGASLALLCGAAVPSIAAAQMLTRTETFDTGPGEFTFVRTPEAGNDFGFSDTNNTDSAGSGAGEAGGTFARSGTAAAFADTDLGGSLTRGDTLEFSGVLTITANNSFDGGFFLGYGSQSGPQQIILSVGEPGAGVPAGQFRGRAQLVSDGGSTASDPVPFGLEVGTDYNVVATYTGGTTQTLSITATPLGGGGGGGISTVSQVDTQTVPFDLFGIGNIATPPSNSGQLVDAFFDDLTYNVVPEPTSLGLLAAAGLWGLRRRRR